MPITIGAAPQYQEQERIQVPNPRQLPMAQAPQGAPLPNLTPDTRPQQIMMANGLASVRDAIQAVALTKRHDENTSFLADMSTIQRSVMEQQDAYRQAKQGQDALTAGQDFETMMDQSFKPYQDKYKDNPRIATALEQKRQELSLAAFGDGSRYAAQQRDVWHKETLDGAIAGWKSALAGGNEAAVHQSWELLDATLATTMPGHDTDAIKQKLLQEGAAITLDRRIATKDYAGFQRDLGNFSSPAAAGSPRSVKGLPPGQPYRFGDIIGQTESGNDYGNVTKLDVNAPSYGKYQFHAGASLTDFLKQSSFGGELQAAGAPGSAGFGAKWRELSQNQQFRDEQDAFAKSYFLDRPLKDSGATWILDRSPAVQEAVMHTFAAAPAVGQRFVADINAAGGNALSDEQILDVIENRYKTKIRDDWPTAIGKAERGEPGGVSQQTLTRTKLDEMAQFRDLLAKQGGGLLPGKQAMWQDRLKNSINSDITKQADVGNIDRARELLAQNGQYLDDDQRAALASFIDNAAQQKARRDEAAQQQQYRNDRNSLLSLIVDPANKIQSMADLYSNNDAAATLTKLQQVHPEAVDGIRDFIAYNNKQAYPVPSPGTDRLRNALVGLSMNDPAAFASMDLDRYVAQLPREDMQSLIQRQMTLNSQQYELQRENVNKVLGAVPQKELQQAGFDKNSKSPDKLDKYNQLVGQVTQETQGFVEQNKRAPTMKESQGIVRSLLTKGAVDSGHWYWPNTNMTMSDAMARGKVDAWQPDTGSVSDTARAAYQNAWTSFSQSAGTPVPFSNDILRSLLRFQALPQAVPDADRSAIIKAFRSARGQSYLPTNQEVALAYVYAQARKTLPPAQPTNSNGSAQ